MGESITNTVIGIIAEQAMLPPAEISVDDTLESLGVDSLGLVESVFAIEEAFDIQVPYNANEPNNTSFDISSVGSIIKAVELLVGEAG